MKQGSRAVAVALLLVTPSCSLFFGDRGGANSTGEVPAAYTESFRRIPEWVRPTVEDFLRAEELRRAVELLERREALKAAVLLQNLRTRESWGAELAALHAWALLDAGSVADGWRVARDGLAEHGASEPSLNYALGVAAELQGNPAEALASYQRVLDVAPLDPMLLRACARTALGAGRAGTALLYLEQLPDEVGSGEGLELARLRATAYSGAERHAEALAVHERIALAHPEDLALREAAAAGAFAAAEAAGTPELRQRALALVQSLAESDPQHVEAQWMLGRLATGLGDERAAESALRRTLELHPGRVDAGLLLATLLDDSLRKDEARAVLFELMRQPLSVAQVEAVQRRILELERS